MGPPTLVGTHPIFNSNRVNLKITLIPKYWTYDCGIWLSIDTQYCHPILGKIESLHF
jgi:hypothetical protein